MNFLSFTFIFTESKISKNYLDEVTKLKCYPVSKDKIERLSNIWKQDEKLIQLLKDVSNGYPNSEDKRRRIIQSVKTRLKGYPVNEGMMKRLSDQ